MLGLALGLMLGRAHPYYLPTPDPPLDPAPDGFAYVLDGADYVLDESDYLIDEDTRCLRRNN